MKTNIDHISQSRRRWVGLSVLLMANFLVVLTSTIVTVAIPHIKSSLHLSDALTAWVLGSYAVAYGVCLIPGGRLGDILGRSRLFLLGLIFFFIGSLIATVAHSSLVLLLGTTLEGVAAGIMIPQVLGSIPWLFKQEERPKAFGFFGVATGLGSALGPLLGGILLSWNPFALSWRSIFLAIATCSVIAFFIGFFILPKIPRNKGSVDGRGALLLAGSLLCLLIPLTDSQIEGWNLLSILLFCLTLPFVICFILYERRKEQTKKEPLLPMGLFKHRSLSSAALIGLSYFATFQSLLFVVSDTLQVGRNGSALEAGLILTPFAITSMVSSVLSSKLMTYLGHGVVVCGTIIIVIGISLLYFLNIDSVPLGLLGGILAFIGIGHGFIVAPNVSSGLKDVPLHEAGTVGGVISTAQRIGQTIGVTVLGGGFLLTSEQKGFITAAHHTLFITTCFALTALLIAVSLLMHPHKR